MSEESKETILRRILNPKTKAYTYHLELIFVLLCRVRHLDPVLFTGLTGYEGSDKDSWAHDLWPPR